MTGAPADAETALQSAPGAVQVRVTVDDRLRVAATDCPPALYEGLRHFVAERCAFDNPLYWQAREHRRPCAHLPRRIELGLADADHLSVPRGLGRELRRAITELNAQAQVLVVEGRCAPPAPPMTLAVALRPYQQEAVQRAAIQRDGVIVAPTGSGKTLMAMGLIARLGVRSLILVHTRTLLDQTCAVVERSLGVQPGRLGGGHDDVRDITVAMVQTVTRRDAAALRDAFGLILLDEAHHCPAATFTEVVQRFRARWRIGLTATPERADALHPLLYATLGPELYRVRPGAMVDLGSLCAAAVQPVETSFRGGRQLDRVEMVTRLCADPTRNAEVVQVVAATRGRHALVLSERVEHCEALTRLLLERQVPAQLLVGKMAPAQRQAALARFLDAPESVLVATSSLVGEGFDCPDLDTLYLAVPTGNTTRTTQALGRVLRPQPGKGAPRVYDFVDAHTPALARSFRARLAVYRKHSASIEVARPVSDVVAGASAAGLQADGYPTSRPAPESSASTAAAPGPSRPSASTPSRYPPSAGSS